MIITPGDRGTEFDIEETKRRIIANLSNLNFEQVDCVLHEKEPQPIDIDAIYKEVVKEPSDAKIIYDANGKASIQTEVVGVDFDLEAARAMITDLYASYTIPVTITNPKITSKDLDTEETGMFSHVLASFTTSLTSVANRTHNIKLASQKINGTILNPG